MAAIVVSVPALLDVFGVLLGSYLNDESLSRGAHWAVAAVAKVRPDLLSDKIEVLHASLDSADPYIRGYAVIALSALAGESVTERLESLRDDNGALDLYSRDTGELRTTTVGALARLLTSVGEDQRNSVDVW